MLLYISVYGSSPNWTTTLGKIDGCRLQGAGLLVEVNEYKKALVGGLITLRPIGVAV